MNVLVEVLYIATRNDRTWRNARERKGRVHVNRRSRYNKAEKAPYMTMYNHSLDGHSEGTSSRERPFSEAIDI